MYKVMVSLGEMNLKGTQTKRKFENILIRNLKNTFNVIKVRKSDGRFLIELDNELNEIKNKMKKIFGVATFAIVDEFNFTTLDKLKEKIKSKYPEIKGKKFRITGKVIGKREFGTIELQKILGEVLYNEGGIVKLKDFELEIFVYIRGEKVQIYEEVIKGSYGLPVGSEGEVLVLFSGGIDSPVATYEIMKRGCKPDLLFINLGGEEHLKHVHKVYKKLCDNWALGVKVNMYVLNGKEIVNLIKEKIKPSYRQIILKKCFYLAAEKLCIKNKYDAIVTGESLGQVSTQTLRNLNAIQNGINKIIVRPLITKDKNETILISKYIETYEESICIGELCNISDKGGVKTSASISETEFEFDKIKGEIEKFVENVSIDTLQPQETYSLKDAVYLDTTKKINIEELDKNTFYVLHCKDGVKASIECDILKKLGFNCTSKKTSQIKNE